MESYESHVWMFEAIETENKAQRAFDVAGARVDLHEFVHGCGPRNPCETRDMLIRKQADLVDDLRMAWEEASALESELINR